MKGCLMGELLMRVCDPDAEMNYQVSKTDGPASGGVPVEVMRLMRGIFLIVLTFITYFWCDVLHASSAEADAKSYIVEQVSVNRRAIFDDETSKLGPVRRAVNALHVTTREAAIIREIGVRAGDEVSQADVAEIERILRRMQIFSEVSAHLAPLADSSRATLHIKTRDRFSIVALSLIHI